VGGLLVRLPGRSDWPPRAEIVPAAIFAGDPRIAEVELLRSLEGDGTRKVELVKTDGTAHFLPPSSTRPRAINVAKRAPITTP